MPARWGLRAAEACRVMGVAERTFYAKVAGTRPITERLIGRIVDVEMLIVSGHMPFGWPFDRKLPELETLELSPRTLDHYRAVIRAQHQLQVRLIDRPLGIVADSVL